MANDATNAEAENRRVLGLALRDLRQRAGVLQRELAVSIGTVDTYVSHVEHGRVDIKWSTLQRVLHAIGADLRQLADAIDRAEREEA